jgi:hypothetical protein
MIKLLPCFWLAGTCALMFSFCTASAVRAEAVP